MSLLTCILYYYYLLFCIIFVKSTPNPLHILELLFTNQIRSYICVMLKFNVFFCYSRSVQGLIESARACMANHQDVCNGSETFLLLKQTLESSEAQFCSGILPLTLSFDCTVCLKVSSNSV